MPTANTRKKARNQRKRSKYKIGMKERKERKQKRHLKQIVRFKARRIRREKPRLQLRKEAILHSHAPRL